MRTSTTAFAPRIALVSLLTVASWPLAQAAQAAPAPICTEQTREAAAAEIKAIEEAPESERDSAEAAVYAKYSNCIQDAALTPSTDPFFTAARQCGATVSLLGSLFFEEMPCCGYDPQRRMFGCPVTVKQRFGFGGAPLPGSREYVMHCVADNNNVLVPVAVDSVHLANEMWGQPPTWQFDVIASANRNLHTVQPMNGITRRARSILSWGLQPTGCDYQPIWGNVINYRIRLDQ